MTAIKISHKSSKFNFVLWYIEDSTWKEDMLIIRKSLRNYLGSIQQRQHKVNCSSSTEKKSHTKVSVSNKGQSAKKAIIHIGSVDTKLVC